MTARKRACASASAHNVEDTVEMNYEAVNVGITTKEITELVAATCFGIVASTTMFWLLSMFMWAWLAFVIAFLATLVLGNQFNRWFNTSGYDSCVNTLRKMGSVFTRSAVAA